MKSMQTAPLLLLLLVAAVSADQSQVDPMGKVISMIDDLAAKVKAEGVAEAKAYEEYFEWCDDTAKNVGFEIKSASSKKEELEATIEKSTAQISASETKIGELADSISQDEGELKDATAIRDKEAADFATSEKELADTIDTLERAIGIISREMAKGASFAQVDTSNLNGFVSGLSAIVDAAGVSGSDKQKLVALVQSQDGEDDAEYGAPAGATYESHSGSIVDVLEDIKEKADTELSDLRKAESSAKHNYAMMAQSLKDQMGADTKDLDAEKASKASSEEAKAGAEGELASTDKDLANAQSSLHTTTSTCMTVATDHEATVKARAEELSVIAQAKKILQETSSGAVSQTYLQVASESKSQMQTSADLKNAEVVNLVKKLAKEQHSPELAQLASRIAAVIRYGGKAGEDPFAKVKSLINDLIAKLENEANEDATEKAYCDEEMSKTEAKKGELNGDISKLSTKIDQASSKSTGLKGEVKQLQADLAALAKKDAELEKIRSEEHADYVQAKSDLELGLEGVRKALNLLRDYYGGASFVQQPAPPAKHEKSSGAGQSIINILEVCESDFARDLATEETEEADSQSGYDTTMQEDKMTKTLKEQDVKYKTQGFKSTDKDITELTSDRDTQSTELSAVLEYYSKLKERCVAKPESYESIKARREAEISGLKDALAILEEEAAFVQRGKRARHHAFLAAHM